MNNSLKISVLLTSLFISLVISIVMALNPENDSGIEYCTQKLEQTNKPGNSGSTFIRDSEGRFVIYNPEQVTKPKEFYLPVPPLKLKKSTQYFDLGERFCMPAINSPVKDFMKTFPVMFIYALLLLFPLFLIGNAFKAKK